MEREVKANRIFLILGILLFFAFLFHGYVYINTQYSFFSHAFSPWVYNLAGFLIILSSLMCFVRYIAERNYYQDVTPTDDEYDNLQVVLHDAVSNGFRESETTLAQTNCTSEQNENEMPAVPSIAETTAAIDFNQLEEDLLTSTKMESLFEVATQWILTNLTVSYVAFSNITANDKLSIEYYKEIVPSEVYLVEAVAERSDNIGGKGNVCHGDHSISVPYFKKGEIFGFVFIGFNKTEDGFEKLDTKYLPPFIRILSTACLVIELAKTKEQRSSLQKAFSSYVPSAIVDLFEHDPSVLKIGGEYENLTIMFTDLREFTTLSETMAPDVLITVLNEYFSEMSGVIETFGGTVSKLVGDGILAFFGGPGGAGSNHAEKCCEAALTMKKYEEILNAKLIASGKIKDPLYTRIGISTGKVILGNIGSEKRLDYTVMGPEVNLASRIEEANKKCGTAILISYETFLAVRNSFECRRAAFIKLKGFSRSVYLFELLSKSKTEDEEKMLLANDLADLLGMNAENLLVTDTSAKKHVPAHAIPANAPVISDDDLEEFEDAEDLEELEELD